jgi:hypothetical protein
LFTSHFMSPPLFRGLHSSTFWLNISAFCGKGGAFRGCLGVVEQVLGGIWGCLGCILCQKWLRLSWKVEECKPLPLFPIRSFIWFPLSYCRNSLDCRTVGQGLTLVRFSAQPEPFLKQNTP